MVYKKYGSCGSIHTAVNIRCFAIVIRTDIAIRNKPFGQILQRTQRKYDSALLVKEAAINVFSIIIARALQVARLRLEDFGMTNKYSASIGGIH